MALFEVLGCAGSGHASDDGGSTRRLNVTEAMGGPTMQWQACNRVFGGVELCCEGARQSCQGTIF